MRGVLKNISVSSEQFILFRALMIYGFIKALIVGNGLYGKKLMLILVPPPSVLPASVGSTLPPTQRKERLLHFLVDPFVSVSCCDF
jgi:hypothetical protein